MTTERHAGILLRSLRAPPQGEVHRRSAARRVTGRRRRDSRRPPRRASGTWSGRADGRSRASRWAPMASPRDRRRRTDRPADGTHGEWHPLYMPTASSSARDIRLDRRLGARAERSRRKGVLRGRSLVGLDSRMRQRSACELSSARSSGPRSSFSPRSRRPSSRSPSIAGTRSTAASQSSSSTRPWRQPAFAEQKPRFQARSADRVAEHELQRVRKLRRNSVASEQTLEARGARTRRGHGAATRGGGRSRRCEKALPRSGASRAEHRVVDRPPLRSRRTGPAGACSRSCSESSDRGSASGCPSPTSRRSARSWKSRLRSMAGRSRSPHPGHRTRGQPSPALRAHGTRARASRPTRPASSSLRVQTKSGRRCPRPFGLPRSLWINRPLATFCAGPWNERSRLHV